MIITEYCKSGNPSDEKSGNRYMKIPFHRALAFLIAIILFLSSGCRKTTDLPKEEQMPLMWEFKMPAEVYYASPALSNDEKTLYTGTSTWLTGTHSASQAFVAIDIPTGESLWQLPLGANEVRSSPAVATDNTIYFAVELRDPVTFSFLGDELWHVSSTGGLLWKFDINPSKLTMQVGLSAPAIGPDGTIYIAGDKLYAINPDGILRWTAFSNPSDALRNAPVTGNDGTVYFVYHNIPLTALNPSDGSVVWSCQLGVNDHCLASPAIGADGTIYSAIQPGLLFAVSSEGQLLWTFELISAGFTGTLRSSPAVDSEGCVYFGINEGNPSSAFIALNPDGTLKWKFEPSDLPEDVPSSHFDIYSSPALGDDSTVYFGQEFGRVYALSTEDGSIKGMAETHQGVTWSSPAIDHNGILYISDISGTVFAFQTGSLGLDSLAPWPRYRSNNQGTGHKSDQKDR